MRNYDLVAGKNQVESEQLRNWMIWPLTVFILLFPLLEGISNEFFPIGTKFLGGIVGFFWIINSIRSGKINIIIPIVLFSLYVIWNACSIFWTWDPELSLERVIGLIQVFIFYWIIVDVVRVKQDIIQIILAYVIGVGMLALSALVNIVTNQTYLGLSNRFSAVGVDPNNFGVLVASSIPLALALAFLKSKVWWGIFYTAFTIPLVLSTASRTALLSLVVGLIGFMFFNSGSKKRIFVHGIILTSTIFTIWYIVPSEAVLRLLEAFSDREGSGRTEIWQLAIELGENAPFRGFGAGTFLSVSETFLLNGMQVHNTFLASWAELGLPGFLLWIGLWLWHLIKITLTKVTETSDRDLKISLLLALLCIFVGTFFLNWEIRKPVYLLWGLVAVFWRLNTKAVDYNS